MLKSQSPEVEEALKRLAANQNVLAELIVNQHGQVIRSTLEDTLAKKHGELISKLVNQAVDLVKELDDSNDLTYVRVRSKKNEIIALVSKDYIHIVIQNPASTT